MTQLTAATLKGNWATLLLPIDTADRIDFTCLADEIDTLIEAGVDGIYSNGTAGEFYNQTEQEFDRINTLLADKCTKAGVPFQIGASHPSPLISLERLRRCLAWHPNAVQVILPDWVAGTTGEQISFMERICAQAGEIPIVLYNPPHAKTVLTPHELLQLLAQVPGIIGIKVAYGNDSWIKQMREVAKHISVFVPGHYLATGVRDGVASGAYSNVACINARAAQHWWQQINTDLASALELEARIKQFFKECILPFQQQGYSNPALDKFLCAVGNYVQVGTRLRWPYQSISEDAVPAVRQRAKQLLPEFFEQ